MKKTWLSLLLTLAVVLAMIPAWALAGDAPFAVAVNGGQTTITGTNPALAGKDATLRIVDKDSRTVVADQVKTGAAGSYAFGPYTLGSGEFTASVGGVGTPSSKTFSVPGTTGPVSANANLAALQLSAGAVAVTPNQTGYTVSVPNRVASLTVTAKAEDTQAKVSINKDAFSVKDIALAVGVNAVAITVTAQDGVTVKNYTLTVKRAAAQQVAPNESVAVGAEPVSLTVPVNAVNAKVTVPASVVGSTKQATLPLVEVQAVTALGTVGVFMPEGVKISAPDTWDGTIKLPQLQSLSSVTINGGTVSAVIEVGSPDVTLTFDKAVRLLIPGQGDKAAGYVRKGVFVPITGTLSADTQEAADREIAAGGDAKIKVGGDLVIWTKHFTQFASYTPGTSSDNGGSSGGSSASNEAAISAAAGGTVTLNGVKIVVPAGATAADIKVIVNKADASVLPANTALTGLGAVYEIKKDKDGDFVKPVVLTLPFDTASVDFAKASVSLYRLNEKTNTWTVLDDVQVDQAKGTVSGAATQFGKFAVLLSAKSAPKEEKPQGFADMNGHWAAAHVQALSKQGALAGYPDNTFKPDNGITRAEFVTAIVKAFNLQAQAGKNFDDTAAHWAKQAIATAAGLGIVNGYSDAAFGPDDRITREQMAVILVRAAKAEAADKNLGFADSAHVSDWARAAVSTAAAKGLLTGYADNTVQPKAYTTRAEAAVVIGRALQLKK